MSRDTITVIASSEAAAEQLARYIEANVIPDLYADSEQAHEVLARHPRTEQTRLHVYVVRRVHTCDRALIVTRMMEGLAAAIIVIGGCLAMGWGALLS